MNDRDDDGSIVRRMWRTRFVRVWGRPTRVLLVNNLFVGGGGVLRGAGELRHNLPSSEPGLVDRIHFDYRLAARSPAINAGIDPGTAHGVALAPVAQYVHPASEEPRASRGPIDVGAYAARPA